MRLLKIAVGTLVVGILICWLIAKTQIQDVRSAAQDNSGQVRVDESARKLAREKKLRQRLAYLREIPEVTYVEIEDNNVYVGFSTLPSDLPNILRAAAMHGNRTINFGVHVWAIGEGKQGWRPGDQASFVQCVTARYGKVE